MCMAVRPSRANASKRNMEIRDCQVPYGSYLGIRTCSKGKACLECRIWIWLIWGAIGSGAGIIVGTLIAAALH